jgi:hypothetical protein
VTAPDTAGSPRSHRCRALRLWARRLERRRPSETGAVEAVLGQQPGEMAPVDATAIRSGTGQPGGPDGLYQIPLLGPGGARTVEQPAEPGA